MPVTVSPITPNFVAEIGDVDLASLSDADLLAIKSAFWKYSVLIFPGPGPHGGTSTSISRGRSARSRPTGCSIRSSTSPRLEQGFADISNLTAEGKIWAGDSRQRMYKAGNKLWHTDSSFKYRPALCSLLYSTHRRARRRPHRIRRPARGLRCAAARRRSRSCEGLVAEHSIATSRRKSGFTRVQRGRGEAAAAGAADAGADHPRERQEVALRGLARRAHIRDAGRRGPRRCSTS